MIYFAYVPACDNLLLSPNGVASQESKSVCLFIASIGGLSHAYFIFFTPTAISESTLLLPGQMRRCDIPHYHSAFALSLSPGYSSAPRQMSPLRRLSFACF